MGTQQNMLIYPVLSIYTYIITKFKYLIFHRDISLIDRYMQYKSK